MSEETGFIGEWIVRVHDITSPEEANAVWNAIGKAIAGLKIENNVELWFDKSRWSGGDF